MMVERVDSGCRASDEGNRRFGICPGIIKPDQRGATRYVGATSRARAASRKMSKNYASRNMRSDKSPPPIGKAVSNNHLSCRSHRKQ